MSQEPFPISAKRVVATLAEILRLQGEPVLTEVLTTASAKIEMTGHGGWDGGTPLFTLYLDVPIPLFSRIEPQVSSIESAISAKAQGAFRNMGGDVLNAVVVSPTIGSAMPDATPAAKEGAEDRLWAPGMLRLFLSHVAVHKVAVADLRRELRVFGVSGFVAHEDIEPSLEWQTEIELALRSMHAMTTLLTLEFHESKWTDQEIGAAVARGVLVIPVRLGLNPYGFIGKNQALPGDLAKPRELASELAGILAKRPSTRDAMKEGLVVALEASLTFANSRAVTTLIESTDGFTRDQLERLDASIEANGQIAGSTGVPQRLRRLLASQARRAE